MSTITAFFGSSGFTSPKAVPTIFSYCPTTGHENPPKAGDWERAASMAILTMRAFAGVASPRGTRNAPSSTARQKAHDRSWVRVMKNPSATCCVDGLLRRSGLSRANNAPERPDRQGASRQHAQCWFDPIGILRSDARPLGNDGYGSGVLQVRNARIRVG